METWVTKIRNPECVLCRALGSCYLVGTGAYLAMHAPAQGVKRWGFLSAASVFGAFGLARAFNLPPFGGIFRTSESADESMG